MGIDWEKCEGYVREKLPEVLAWLEQHDPGSLWRWYADFMTYPPRIVLSLEVQTEDDRRVEAYPLSLTRAPRVRYPTDRELELAGTVAAGAANHVGMRVYRARDLEDPGELIYVLKPLYGDFEKKGG